MKEYVVLYNPYAQKGHGLENAKRLEDMYPDAKFYYEDMTKIMDHLQFIADTPAERTIVFTGGDGTLNRFVNVIYGEKLDREILYFPAGPGNDFVSDLHKEKNCAPFPINSYVENLPKVTVNGQTCRFINAIGYGLDGYCCEESDRLRRAGKSRSYALIAFIGLLGKYHPVSGTVTVDGISKHYEKIWMAPVMFGSYYGGGILMGPDQRRDNAQHTVTSVCIHDLGRLRTLFLFLSVIRGNGRKYPDVIDYRTGHEVRVHFDTGTALQIDGETRKSITDCMVKYS